MFSIHINSDINIPAGAEIGKVGGPTAPGKVQEREDDWGDQGRLGAPGRV